MQEDVAEAALHVVRVAAVVVVFEVQRKMSSIPRQLFAPLCLHAEERKNAARALFYTRISFTGVLSELSMKCLRRTK